MRQPAPSPSPPPGRLRPPRRRRGLAIVPLVLALAALALTGAWFRAHRSSTPALDRQEVARVFARALGDSAHDRFQVAYREAHDCLQRGQPDRAMAWLPHLRRLAAVGPFPELQAQKAAGLEEVAREHPPLDTEAARRSVRRRLAELEDIGVDAEGLLAHRLSLAIAEANLGDWPAADALLQRTLAEGLAGGHQPSWRHEGWRHPAWRVNRVYELYGEYDRSLETRRRYADWLARGHGDDGEANVLRVRVLAELAEGNLALGRVAEAEDLFDRTLESACAAAPGSALFADLPGHRRGTSREALESTVSLAVGRLRQIEAGQIPARLDRFGRRPSYLVPTRLAPYLEDFAPCR